MEPKESKKYIWGQWHRIPKKKKGQYRDIFAPAESYKRNLRRINKYYLSNVPISDAAYGCVPGRNVVMNAKQHIGDRHVLTIDLKDFFNHVTPDKLKGKVSEKVANYCTKKHYKYGEIAAQGLNTSGMLANIAAFEMDLALSDYALQNNLIYTRYVDDMAFSFKGDGPNKPDEITVAAVKAEFNRIKNEVKAIIEDNGFQMHPRKIKYYYSWGGNAVICGVAVTENNVKAPYKSLKKIRAAKHQHNQKSLEGLQQWERMPEPNEESECIFIKEN